MPLQSRRVRPDRPLDQRLVHRRHRRRSEGAHASGGRTRRAAAATAAAAGAASGRERPAPPPPLLGEHRNMGMKDKSRRATMERWTQTFTSASSAVRSFLPRLGLCTARRALWTQRLSSSHLLLARIVGEGGLALGRGVRCIPEVPAPSTRLTEPRQALDGRFDPRRHPRWAVGSARRRTSAGAAQPLQQEPDGGALLHSSLGSSATCEHSPGRLRRNSATTADHQRRHAGRRGLVIAAPGCSRRRGR